ncbi:hypothetical protein [uncultured Draconibacterium sp.]|uniref:hypothetical protein n=1 Tax=uncultured Draconibacterium sp. TaxID=1573823 RepID=UPI0029C67A7F|nr:hypothetical protein [uncultured Draconibacterium sp.]
MKKFTSILTILLLFVVELYAQPDLMNYQGVARDNSGQVIANTSISLRISILSNSSDGFLVFSEIHKVTTSDFGVFSLKIGSGSSQIGKLRDIEWGQTNHYIKVEMDINGGANFIEMGTSQLLSVPYAFHAQTATFLTGEQNTVLKSSKSGVPSQNWSLFGNSKTDAEKDKLGTTDFADLVLVTDNLDRLRIFANGDISIRKSLEIGEALTVKQNVYLNTERGETINNGPLTVHGATDLKNTLNVDGETDLNSALRVNNQSPTTLSGTLTVVEATDLQDKLNVDGETDLNNELRVNNQSATKLSGTLTVEQATVLNSTLNVADATTIDGATTINNTLTANGQVTINANVSGGESNYGAYPLRVEGSEQGIAIKVNAETPANKNNFVTFFDKNNNVRGRIEGETTLELLTNPEYIFDNTMFAADIFITGGELAIAIAEEVQAIAEGVSYGLSENICVGAGEGLGLVVVEVVCPPAPAQAITVASNIALKSANLFLVGLNEAKAIAEPTAYNIFKHTQIGVTYQSGAGDYAEWLEKSDLNEQFHPGDIVGVKGGKISSSTRDASTCMVVSSNPIVLGNMPDSGNESEYEKIAFMGQVPVKVYGRVNEGDYIIPSGNNDGFGIAVNPNDIKVNQLQNIVGIAWSSSANHGINYVNVAVGLNANDMAKHTIKLEKKIEAQAKEIEMLKARFDKMDELLANMDAGYVQSGKNVIEKSATTPTAPEEESEPSVTYFKITEDDIEQGIELAKSKLQEAGVDVENHPFFMKIQTDAEYKQQYKNRIIQEYDNEIEKRAKLNDKTGIRTIIN